MESEGNFEFVVILARGERWAKKGELSQTKRQAGNAAISSAVDDSGNCKTHSRGHAYAAHR